MAAILTPMQVPLRLGTLEIPGRTVVRSGLRWLREDGQICHAGEVVAYCSIDVWSPKGKSATPGPFSDERRDFQVAISTPVSGRLHHASGATRGGFFDQLNMFKWFEDFVIGHIDVASPAGATAEAAEVQLLMLAGRRTTELAEVRSGMMTGWYDRSRGWRVQGDGPMGTLLSLGTCELDGVIKGERSAFLEIFEAIEGSAHVVFMPDPPLVPSARFLAEQIIRTPAQFQEIAQDFTAALVNGEVQPAAQDWLFAGAFLMGLQRSPITDSYPILSRSGLLEAGPANAVILSLNAEPMHLLRHRKLGYSIWIHGWRMVELGKAVSQWFAANFELAQRSVADIQSDYRALIDLIRERAPETQILICNRMSTSEAEDVQNYAGFDAPLGATLMTVNAKDLNLMLYDLARERDIAVVDIDAIAAEFGARAHLHVDVHQSGPMQAEIRAEVLRILDARGVPGFVRRRRHRA